MSSTNLQLSYTRWVDLYGESIISCPSSGLSARIQFVKASYWSSKRCTCFFTQDDVIFVQIFACKQRFLEVNYLYGRFLAHLRSRCRYTLHSPEWEIPRPTNICQPAGHQDVVVAHDCSRLILSTLFDIMQRYTTNF